MSDNNDQLDKKRLLILTGPQGSGNHLFSRIFSVHEQVSGWTGLLEEYWVPSDLEPFAPYWVDPDRLTADVFDNSNYFLANVSCPFFYDGVRYVPKIVELAQRAASFGIDVSVAIIVRDQNINAVQQQRVRGEVTTPIAQDYYYNHLIPSNVRIDFIDHEAFFLHKQHYLKWLSRTLDFPIAWDNPDVMKFITEDANHKYVKYVEEYWLDQEVWKGVRPMKNRGIEEKNSKD
jgi:hypothetical protein